MISKMAVRNLGRQPIWSPARTPSANSTTSLAFTQLQSYIPKDCAQKLFFDIPASMPQMLAVYSLSPTSYHCKIEANHDWINRHCWRPICMQPFSYPALCHILAKSGTSASNASSKGLIWRNHQGWPVWPTLLPNPDHLAQRKAAHAASRLRFHDLGSSLRSKSQPYHAGLDSISFCLCLCRSNAQISYSLWSSAYAMTPSATVGFFHLL